MFLTVLELPFVVVKGISVLLSFPSEAIGGANELFLESDDFSLLGDIFFKLVCELLLKFGDTLIADLDTEAVFGDSDLDSKKSDDRNEGTGCTEGDSFSKRLVGLTTHSEVVFGGVSGALVVAICTSTDKIGSCVRDMVTL